MATRYSDDPDRTRHGGDLGFNSPGSFVEPVRKAIAGMKTRGEIAGPVEAENGFHILRFVERRPPRPIPFEAVAKQIMEAEAERLRKQKTEAAIREVRDSKTVVVHRDNLERLVLPLDPESLRKALEEKSAAAK